MSKGIDQQLLQNKPKQEGALDELHVKQASKFVKSRSKKSKHAIETVITPQQNPEKDLADTSFSCSPTVKRATKQTPRQDLRSTDLDRARSGLAADTVTDTKRQIASEQSVTPRVDRSEPLGDLLKDQPTILDRFVNWVATQIKKLEEQLIASLSGPSEEPEVVAASDFEEELALEPHQSKRKKKKWHRIVEEDPEN
ncbi:hypothetical protein OAO01_01835 [Oligoflexia bacterium]|nr:hypothetical protein [Oligoflexia bacterium]